jgi:hypothetical protein
MDWLDEMHLIDMADRAFKSAAQGVLVSIPVASGYANAWEIDWRLAAGMGMGMAFLSLVTNIAQHGLLGRKAVTGGDLANPYDLD